MAADELSPDNTFMVGVSGANIILLKPPRGSMSKSDALNLAAWIVAVADDDDKFPALLSAVQNT